MMHRFRRMLFVFFITVSLLFSCISFRVGTTKEFPQSDRLYCISSGSSIVITSDDDFVNQGWPGNGSASAPFIIEGQTITSDMTCISISGTSSYFIIRDCILTITVSYKKAMKLTNVVNGVIISNTVTFDLIGMDFVRCSSCVIEGNTLHRPSLPYQPDIHAIRVYDSDHMDISRNRISSASVGHASSANRGILVNTSTYCTIRENRVQPFLGRGIYLESSGYCDLIDNLCNGSSSGYYVRASSNCYLENNRAMRTGMGFGIWVGQDHTLVGNRAERLFDDGFIIANSYNCQLIGNIVRNISDCRNGIELIYGSANNILYGNFILFSNVFDNGTNNGWDNGAGFGNYWSSYNGTGTYPIPGTAGSVDRFPQHFIVPVINLVSVCGFEYGFENRFLNWTYSGQAPISYTLERLNESQIYQIEIAGLWNEFQTTLSLYLEPTEVGEYIYRFTALYTGGFSLVEEMVVHIVPASGPHIEYVLTGSEYPAPEYDIAVIAIVNDISGVSKVTLSYNSSIDGLWSNITMDWNEADLWTAMVPGLPNNTILYLKVYAIDTLGNWAVTGVMKKLVTDSPPTLPTIPHTSPDQEGSFITVLLIGGIMVEISVIAYMILNRRYK